MTRQAFVRVCGGEWQAKESEAELLTTARADLPAAVIAVKDGRAKTAEYWSWMCATVAAWTRREIEDIF